MDRPDKHRHFHGRMGHDCTCAQADSTDIIFFDIECFGRAASNVGSADAIEFLE